MKQFKKGIALLMALTIFSILLQPSFPVIAAKPAEASPTSQLTILVRSSQTALMFSKLEISNPKITKAILNAKKEATNEASLFTDIEVSFMHGQQLSHYRMEKSGELWDEAASQSLIVPPAITESLLKYTEALRKSHYGKLTKWEDARRLVARKSIFSITDLETGLSFKVQRRAGSSHADVQPITKEDSKIMSQIYGGHWSWKRKAILVQSGGKRIAASMNGMPHGGDGIPDNGFSGHFCVHFLDSTSHRSTAPDPAHQLMVYKATGNLRPYLDSASPMLLAESFIEAMNQQDVEMLQQIANGMTKERLSYFVTELGSLSSIRIHLPKKLKQINPSGWNESLTTDLNLPIKVHKNSQPDRNTHYRFIFKRESNKSPWNIDDLETKGATNHSSLIP
ncbi:hypothetical protein [Cohnella sp. WQ 127256]|uniref:hypothetical protein n=1 Tax=Cohnella sp. WQ 127256 TaxID=2938790 RepID=UPI0021175337|nr:hypothetical protein [Cohnella sp. WQ 127256]